MSMVSKELRAKISEQEAYLLDMLCREDMNNKDIRICKNFIGSSLTDGNTYKYYVSKLIRISKVSHRISRELEDIRVELEALREQLQCEEE